jgi:hypothetical protein
MSDKQQEKANFLAAGINSAVPPKSAVPPPPVVKRPREREVEDENTQTSENANSQSRKTENSQKMVQAQAKPEQEPATTPTSVLTDEQVRMLAEMLSSANATTQQTKKAKRQKIDLADLLIQTIANSEGSEIIKERFSKVANSQKTKINQGVFAPEALFNIYRDSSVQLGLLGKKVSMGDLMAKALIAYVPEIMRELEEE